MHFNRIFLCFLCFTLLLGGCTVAAEAELKTAANGTEEHFLDTLTFLGDSTTAHMLSRAPLKNGRASTQVWATNSRYLNLSPRITYEKIVCPENGREMTIAEAAALLCPERLVITLGIDYGVYYYRNDQASFRHCYEKLLDAIATASPKTTVVLQSIFPVGRSCSVITNEMVDRANTTIGEIAAARGLVFVDATTPLRDAEGYLAPAYCYSEDGIHLSEAAYRVILENLQKYESEIIGK